MDVAQFATLVSLLSEMVNVQAEQADALIAIQKSLSALVSNEDVAILLKDK